MRIEQDAVDKFAALLMRQVRDTSIRQIGSTLDGTAKAPFDKSLHERIASTLSPDQIDLVRYLVPYIVDQVLFDTLVALDQTDWVDVALRTEWGSMVSLRDMGVDLHDELYGWIRTYSEEPIDWLEDFDSFENPE